MFTQNFQNYMFNNFFGLGNENYSVGSLRHMVYTNVHGSTITPYGGKDHTVKGFGKALHYPKIQTVGAYGIYFGTGSTPATINDYKLNNLITSGLSSVYTTVSVAKEAEGRYAICGQYTLQNTSNEPISISEIGVVTGFDTSSSGATAYVLMERTVLGEPITIDPGKAKTVTYKLTFNQGQNV